MPVVRPALAMDIPGAYRVCLLTGDAGRDGSALFRNPDLLGHVYVGPYITGEPDLALVVADAEGIAGYCLKNCTTDTDCAGLNSYCAEMAGTAQKTCQVGKRPCAKATDCPTGVTCTGATATAVGRCG